jgi:hypothetical protein
VSLEEVASCAGRKVLMLLTYISQIDDDPQWILDQQLRPHPIHLLNIITIILINNIEKEKKCSIEPLVEHAGFE